jgi:hypothetical protein
MRLTGLASIKWTVELSPYCPFLELDWTDITKVSVSSLAVVETFDIVEHIGPRLQIIFVDYGVKLYIIRSA